jgi:hypothetical protein
MEQPQLGRARQEREEAQRGAQATATGTQFHCGSTRNMLPHASEASEYPRRAPN